MAHHIQPTHRLLATGILSIDAALHCIAGAAASSAAAVQPSVGALFAGSYFVVSHLVNYGCQRLETTSVYPLNAHGTIAKTLKLALTLIAGAGASILLLSLLELPLVFSAAAVLSSAMCGTTALIAMLMTGSYHVRNVAVGTKFFLP